MLFYFLMDSLAGFLTRDRSGEEAADFKVMSCFSKNLVKSMHVCPANSMTSLLEHSDLMHSQKNIDVC